MGRENWGVTPRGVNPGQFRILHGDSIGVAVLSSGSRVAVFANSVSDANGSFVTAWRSSSMTSMRSKKAD